MLISYVACDAAKLRTFHPGDGAGVNTFDLLGTIFIRRFIHSACTDVQWAWIFKTKSQIYRFIRNLGIVVFFSKPPLWELLSSADLYTMCCCSECKQINIWSGALSSEPNWLIPIQQA